MFDNLEERLSEIFRKKVELKAEEEVLRKEKEFRQHVNSPYRKYGRKYKGVNAKAVNDVKGFLTYHNKIRLDNIKWFAEYKRKDYPKISEDMNSLISLLESDEVYLSEALRLEKGLEKYGFEIYISNNKSRTHNCITCGKKEVHEATLRFLKERIDGGPLDHGWSDWDETRIINDVKTEVLLNVNFKIKKSKLEEYEKSLKEEIKKVKLDINNLEEVKSSINSIKYRLSEVEKIKGKNYMIYLSGDNKMCSECYNNPDYKKLNDLNYSYKFVKHDWLELELI